MKNRDQRVRNNSDETRASRTAEENTVGFEAETPLVSQGNSGQMFMDEFNFEALPDPNANGDPNFHYFWATMTNNSDSPHRRIRMGYQLVTSEERPEYKHLRVKSGEFEGVVSINEMILMKIPMDLYQRYMLEMHHNRPNEEEVKLKSSAKLGHMDKNGNPLDVDLKEDEGYREMGKTRRAPTRFE